MSSRTVECTGKRIDEEFSLVISGEARRWGVKRSGPRPQRRIVAPLFRIPRRQAEVGVLQSAA